MTPFLNGLSSRKRAENFLMVNFTEKMAAYQYLQRNLHPKFQTLHNKIAPEQYLADFKEAAAKLDKTQLASRGLNVETGIWLKSVVLRLQKNSWANKPFEQPQTGPGIFFSIWLSEPAVKENKILYNIHALKLRQLKGHKIASREFAVRFRTTFTSLESNWPNLSTAFGPLTLMQGWQPLDPASLQTDILSLSAKFFEVAPIIDGLLKESISSR